MHQYTKDWKTAYSVKLKILTITSSRLPLLFFPLVFTRPFDGEGGVDLTGVLMGDGVLGEVC